MRNPAICLTCALWMSLMAPASADGLQAPPPAAVDAYVRLVSNHFGVPESEVRIFAETTISHDELPVVLRISRLSGIAPAAVLARRRTGEGWSAIAGRHQIGAASFYVAFPDEAVDASVERVHRLFAETPTSERDRIALRDEEFVILANLHLLAREMDASYREILGARAASASFVAAVPRLMGIP